MTQEQQPAAENVRPFSNGTQYMDWYARNCDRCAKDVVGDATAPFRCPIQSALFTAECADGSVTPEVAKRMGYDPKRYTWPCPELEARP